MRLADNDYLLWLQRNNDIFNDYLLWLQRLSHMMEMRSSFGFMDQLPFDILLRTLVDKEFYSIIPNDDNRIADALKLREEYADIYGHPEILDVKEPCNCFEMLVALSRRCAYQLSEPEDRAYIWFWEMLDNLGLDFSTPINYDSEDDIDDVIEKAIDRMVERTYSANGSHGLFPLNHPKEDQRKVEIWYQMSAYILEHYYD